MALSMIEQEKMAYQYPSHRVSMVSPPPPPYISASPSLSSSDHGAGVGLGINITTTNTQSAAIITIAPPLQQVPDQQHQPLPYDPAILTSASLAAPTQNKRHSYPAALARSASPSSSSSFSSPAIIIAGSGATIMTDNGVASAAPRVYSTKSMFSRDNKRHSLAAIPSSSSAITMSAPVGLPRPKLISHRGSNMPPQAIPIYSSTGSSAATAEMMMTMMMKTPPTAFNPRSSLSSTRLLESLKHASSSSASCDSDGMGIAEKDLSDLIGPEDDHKNTLPMLLSQANIHHHNMATLSSPPRTQQQGLLRIASLQRATAAASAAERNLILSTSRIGGGGGTTTTGGGPIERNAQFPGFWEDAKQHHMHWTVYSIGLAAVASLVWVLMMPTLMVWVPILPGAVVLLMGVQYSHLYNNHDHVRRVSIGGLVGSSAVAGGGMGHAYRSSLSSMHTSVGSIAASDSFLEPHQPPSSTSSPPHHLRSQFQHQYYRPPGMGSVTGSSSATGSPPRFSEAYPDSTLTPSTMNPSPSTPLGCQATPNYQTPSPEYRRSWFSAFRTPVNTNTDNSDTKNSNSGRWGRTIQRRESSSSSSSIASSETVSSSSTDSGVDSPSSATHAPPSMTESLSSASGSFSSIPMTSSPDNISKMHSLSSGDLSTIMMLPPPPAYVSRRCEDLSSDMTKAMLVGVNEKEQQQMGEKSIAVLGLPEIAPLGDLMSEFAVDFGAIMY
ncbi:hypothetical protein BGZ95_005794 [Linnemannia exigua]|uniref:Uncharacterized protein n=1 Tax=Linnemannia exigua TaxID=604196 RepID=A0AAD4DGL3_9FUNG|nr:hypothetical protein BGZ95_005794 [Linnemannia exigua]